MNGPVTFPKNEEGVKLLAIFIATLTKEGVVYTVSNYETYVAVNLTGGY